MSRSQEAMTQKLCEYHISQLNEGNFYPILVTDVFGFVYVLISFWNQRSKVKVTAGGGMTVDGRRKPVEFHLV